MEEWRRKGRRKGRRQGGKLKWLESEIRKEKRWNGGKGKGKRTVREKNRK